MRKLTSKTFAQAIRGYIRKIICSDKHLMTSMTIGEIQLSGARSGAFAHNMTLSSREVSLSEHVKRRRSRPPLHHHPDVEGGFDTHAASYGNYDSNRCRSYPAPDHGCYAAEDSIVAPRSGRLTPPTRSASSVRFHLSSPSSDLDMLDGRSHRMPMSGSSDCPARRTSQTNTTAHADPSKRPSQYMHTNQEDIGSTMTQPHYPRSYYESSSYSHCPSVASASTASTIGSSSSSSNSGYSNSSTINEPVIPEDNEIQQGIYDISSLVATYLAGALAFVIGLFLLVLSPFIKAIRLVVSDIRGLLGDLGILHEFGNILRLWRELRRRSRRRNDNYGRYDNDLHDRDVVNRYHDDESTVHTDSSTVHTEHSPQFVGGWRPSCPSVGSYGSSTATNNDRPFRQSTPENSMRSWRREDRSQSTRSHSSLPLYNRDDEYYPGRHQSRLSRDVSSLR